MEISFGASKSRDGTGIDGKELYSSYWGSYMKEKEERQTTKKSYFNRDLVAAAVFVLFILCVPILTLGQRLVSGGEKAPSMEQKDDDAQNQGWFPELQDEIRDFTKELFLRKELISFDTELASVLSWNTYIQSTQVLLGKEGWLFYKAQTDVHPLWDYMGTHYYSDEELESAAQNLTMMRDYFEKEAGIRFIVVTYPNKENVYSEYMPDTVLRVNEESRADRVAAYLREHTDTTYLFPKSEILSAKDQFQLYYNTDTHWNAIGAFVGLQAVFREVYGRGAGPDTVRFSISQKNYKGDLATIAGLSDRYAVDNLYDLDETSIDPAQYHDEVLLLVGDSFSENLAIVAEPYYREVYRVYIGEFTMETLEQYEPDILIWENVERNIYKLAEINLLDM